MKVGIQITPGIVLRESGLWKLSRLCKHLMNGFEGSPRLAQFNLFDILIFVGCCPVLCYIQ